MYTKFQIPFLVLAVVATLLAACGRSPSPDGATALEPATIPIAGPVTALDADASDHYGEAVALGDGVMLVGAPDHEDDPAIPGAGSIYVLELGVGGWSEVDQLFAPAPVADAEFGAAIDLDADLAAVGAPGDDAVHLFAEVAGSWLHQTTLTPSLFGDHFGRSVALADDLLVVGAPLDDGSGFNAGAVFVYEYSGAVWVEVARFEGANAGDQFGYAVASDGERVVAGSVFADEVVVYERGGVAWNATATLANPAAPSDFGTALAVQGDTVLVGAPEDDTAATNAGAVYVFEHDGSSWNQSDLWTSSIADPDDQFGATVAIDGDHAIVGSLFSTPVAGSGGSSHLFRRSDGAWSEVEDVYGAGAFWFGDGVAIHGSWAASGASRDSVAAFQAGALYPVDLAAVLPAPLCQGLPATIHPLDPGPGGAVANAAGGYDITGTGAADVIVGSDGPDAILGLAGNDVICALDGDDVVAGNRGADTILGGLGHLDALFGNRGPDTLIDLDGTATMAGGLGDDTLEVAIPFGWNGGSTLFTDLRGGYGDDTVAVDNGVAGITVQISGDELDNPPDPREGSADVLVPSGLPVDPGSSIIKFP